MVKIPIIDQVKHCTLGDIDTRLREIGHYHMCCSIWTTIRSSTAPAAAGWSAASTTCSATAGGTWTCTRGEQNTANRNCRQYHHQNPNSLVVHTNTSSQNMISR